MNRLLCSKIVGIFLLSWHIFLPAAPLHVFAIAGSNSQYSLNRKLLAEAIYIIRVQGEAEVTVGHVNLPMFSVDHETMAGMPEEVHLMRQAMIASEVIIIASPEYNGSLTAPLKNFIDWMSRSEEGQPSRDAFKGKIFLIMSSSPSPYGGKNGLKHLREIITRLGGLVMSDEVVIPEGHQSLQGANRLHNAKLIAMLQSAIAQTFAQAREAC